MKDYKPFIIPIIVSFKITKEDSSPLVDEIIYRLIIGSLMYITFTRSKIMFEVNLKSRFMHFSHKSYFKVAKIILYYVNGTKTIGLWYKTNYSYDLVEYIYANYVGSLNNQRIISSLEMVIWWPKHDHKAHVYVKIPSLVHRSLLWIA